MSEIIPVIILNYNSANHTIKNITSMLENISDDIKYQFIVIDNNSHEEDMKLLVSYIDKFRSSFFELRDKHDLENIIDIQELYDKEIIYIKMKKNYGFSYSNNIGLNLSYKLGYDYAIISNPDTRVIDKTSIKNMLNILKKNKNIGVVFPKVIDPNGIHQEIMHEINFYTMFIYNIFYPILYIPTKIYRKLKNSMLTYENYTKIYTSIGCFFMISIEYIHEVNFFDEEVFLYTEEHILAEKMKSIEKDLVCANECTIFHDHIILNKENDVTDKLRNEAIKYFLKKYLNYSDKKIDLINKGIIFHRRYYARLIDKMSSKLKFIINLK